MTVFIQHLQRKFLCLTLILTFNVGGAALAQDSVSALTKADESEFDFTLDGKLDEAIWDRIPYFDGMRVITPDTLAPAAYETHTRIFYTERGIYLGVMNYQPEGSIVARMTSRDRQIVRDGFVLMIDPSGEGFYGYGMRVNVGGSLNDITILPERQYNTQWDGAWDGKATVVEGGWIAEMFIPWSMMALPQVTGERRRIGVYTERQIGATGETWSFPALPGTGSQFLSSFARYELEDIEPRRQITYYPYIASTHDAMRNDSTMRAGAEVFWRPTSNTQLSASLNPDFGNVESDDVVVNLTAFETFFAEKRSFFLEGQDVFITSPRARTGSGPSGPTTMLNTRRIGSAPRLVIPAGISVLPTDQSQPSDLLGAVKVTGQSGSWRYGSLIASEDDMQIRGKNSAGERVTLNSQGRDYLVGRLVYEDTSAGGRRSIGWMGTNVTHPDIDAVVNGIDLHYFSADTQWAIDTQLLHSDVGGTTGAGGFADISYQPVRGRQHRVSLGYLDDSLDLNNLGFFSRNDFVQADYTFSLDRSDVEGLRALSDSISVINQWTTSGRPTRLSLFLNRRYTFLDNTAFSTSLRYFPPRVDDRLGRGSGVFKIPERWGITLNWTDDPSKKLSTEVGVTAGQEDLGSRSLTFSAGLAYRPIDNFSVLFDLSYTDREALLVYKNNGRYTSFEATQWSPNLSMDYFLSAKQQLRFSMQWTGLKAFEDRFLSVNPDEVAKLRIVNKPTVTPENFVISRMTFQARYRWEIAPLSDLFVVYTRGSNLPGSQFDDYGNLLIDAWEHPIVDTIAVKLRYRFGS
ncbi:MAG: DUF5916 domain-containing protein [Pseudohongiella sp.]|nr:DUF5916 domain-containing protein [Pseudohongiella sp.]